MRILFAVVIVAAMLTGCSDKPNVSDLTKEQLAALQALGEIITPDPGYERYEEAEETVHARVQVYADATRSCIRGTDEYREALAKEWSFKLAEITLTVEWHDRREADGSEKASDWYIAEIKKSDDQLIEDWAALPPGYPQ